MVTMNMKEEEDSMAKSCVNNSSEEMHYMLTNQTTDTTSIPIYQGEEDKKDHDSEIPEDGEKNESIQKKKEEYIHSFTVHGVSRVFDGSRSETSFWTSIVIIGILVTIYGIYNLVIKYYSYEIYTSFSSKVTNENTFPAVTFCDDQLMKRNYFQTTFCEVERDGVKAKPCSFPSDPPEIQNILEDGNGWSNGYFHVSECTTWGSKSCLDDKHLKSLSKHAHKCFTWNFNGTFFDSYGRASIKFTINRTRQNDDLNPHIVASTHDHRISELELMHGVSIKQGQKYVLTVRKTVINRLPPPFPSKCTWGKPHGIFPGKYTRTTCLDSINYLNMLKACGNTIDYVKRLLDPELVDKYRIQQNFTRNEAWSCMQKFAGGTVLSTDMCPVPCEELDLVTMTTVYNPNNPSNDYVVDIQLQDVDSYKVVTENQVFTWDQLAGGIGGFLGLMIGASLVSVIEILVYVVLCLFQKLMK